MFQICWINSALNRRSPRVSPAHSWAFHGWVLKNTNGQNKYYLSDAWKAIVFPSPRPLMREDDMALETMPNLLKKDNWEKIETHNVHYYSFEIARDLFEQHEQYLLSDLDDPSAEAARLLVDNDAILPIESVPVGTIKELSPSKFILADREQSDVYKVGTGDGGVVRRIRIKRDLFEQYRIAFAFGLVLEADEASRLLLNIDNNVKYYYHEYIG